MKNKILKYTTKNQQKTNIPDLLIFEHESTISSVYTSEKRAESFFFFFFEFRLLGDKNLCCLATYRNIAPQRFDQQTIDFQVEITANNLTSHVGLCFALFCRDACVNGFKECCFFFCHSQHQIDLQLIDINSNPMESKSNNLRRDF
jgi:hypothetical protein